jgi:3-hydroxyacyl-[acyl-carrier-protein] dehydratase
MMDIGKILSALPHRYPFLLVDRVVEVVKGERIHAYKNITFNEEFFQGHFPGAPVMPGVLQLEALAQTGGLLAYDTSPWDATTKLVLFMSMDKVKFRRIVTPGDRLDLHVTIDRVKGSIWKFKGEAKVDGQVASEAEMMAMIADRKD